MLGVFQVGFNCTNLKVVSQFLTGWTENLLQIVLNLSYPKIHSFTKMNFWVGLLNYKINICYALVIFDIGMHNKKGQAQIVHQITMKTYCMGILM